MGWVGGVDRAKEATSPDKAKTSRHLRLGEDVTKGTCAARLSAIPVWLSLLEGFTVGSGVSLVVSVRYDFANGICFR